MGVAWGGAARAAAFLTAAGSAAAMAIAAAGTDPGTEPRLRRAGRTAASEARRIEEYDAPAPGWREGPVRYLLSKDEDDAFRALRTDADRAVFILKFWASRDTNPATPENEYRTLFYRRVTEANRQFRDAPREGWKTDRGKIYVLLGPPDELEILPPPGTVRDRGRREVIVWTYRANRSGMDLEERTAVRFVREPSGEYRLSNDVRLSWRESSLGLGLQVQAMQMKSLPEAREVLDSIVSARSALDAAPFRIYRNFFRAADGNTFAVLTVGLNPKLISSAPAPPPPPEVAGGAAAAPGAAGAPDEGRFDVMARLVGDDPGLPSYDLAGPSGLRAATEPGGPGPDDDLLFQGGSTLKPGRYTAYYGVVDRSTRAVFSFSEPLEVPDLHREGLALGSVTLASRLERVPGASGAGYSRPFVLGDLKVLPRPDDLYRVGETFAFYYQVYGPATDPIDGRPDLDAEYQFLVIRESGGGAPAIDPIGSPVRLQHLGTFVHGYSLALQDWAPGAYRLRVRVRDNLAGAEATREVDFRVLGG